MLRAPKRLEQQSDGPVNAVSVYKLALMLVTNAAVVDIWTATVAALGEEQQSH